MHPNLKAEMKRKGVSKRDICRKLEMDERTLTNRLNGKHPFRLPEAFAIRDSFFPGMSIDYLFDSPTV